MGLDGFSMSNLGMHRNLTSAQLANEADALAKQTLENQIADVDGVGKREKAGAKDKDAAFNGTIPFIADDEEEKEEQNEEEAEEENNENQTVDESEENEEDYEKYNFRLTSNNMIEVWDAETNKVLRSISVEEAKKVVGKFDKVPGFLINKTI